MSDAVACSTGLFHGPVRRDVFTSRFHQALAHGTSGDQHPTTASVTLTIVFSVVGPGIHQTVANRQSDRLSGPVDVQFSVDPPHDVVHRVDVEVQL